MEGTNLEGEHSAINKRNKKFSSKGAPILGGSLWESVQSIFLGVSKMLVEITLSNKDYA